MSELRQDIATGSWVIIAPERMKGKSFDKLKNPLRDTLPEYDENCPFCPQNESRFENIEKAKIPYPDSDNPFKSSWQARAIENKYKIFNKQDKDRKISSGFEIEGIYNKAPSNGEHDLIIENPQHNKCFGTMTQDEVVAVIKLYTMLFNQFSQTPGTLLTVIFKNHGFRSGASQVHPHSQVISMGVVPNFIRFLLAEAQRYFDSHGRCVFCAINDYELQSKKRMIYENKRFCSFIPYAASVPYQTMIMPKVHDSLFGDMTEDEIQEFADCLRITMKKLYIGLSNPDFNMILRNPPYPLSRVPFYHWQMEIVPHILTQGGFELGSRMNVNVVVPEESAEHLRSV